MKTKVLELLASDSESFDDDKYIPVNENNLDEIIDKLRQFMIERVKPLLEKHECCDNLIHFINHHANKCVTVKLEVVEGLTKNCAYVKINIPLLVGNPTIPLETIVKSINNMMSSLDCFRPNVVICPEDKS